MSKSLSLLCLAVSLVAADRYQASEPHMGTLVTITLYAESSEQAQQGFLAAFARIKELNAILSDYNPNSELSQVARASGLRLLSPELTKVLAHAQRLAEQTDGAFDITVGPLSHLWREARAQKRLPSQDAIADALRRSGYRKLELYEGTRTARFLVEGMRLDAGGIAKGYAADEALATLRGMGISSALVAVSGDIAIGDAPPGQPGWRVGVGDETRTLKNVGVSTSGDEFQFVEIEGVRYSHIIDSRTGMPLRNSHNVSVIAGSAMEADALATAKSVLGLTAH